MESTGRPVRLWARQTKWDVLGAALAALAVSASTAAALPSGFDHPILFRLCVWIIVVFGLFGLGLFHRGLFAPVPVVDVEVSWNTAYDDLRNRSARFGTEVVSAHLPHLHQEHSITSAAWEAHAMRVPIPKVGHEALHVWVKRLQSDPDPLVRMFFELAQACEGITAGSEYRRLAVRTYDIFWRSRETKDGFRDWMAENNVKDGGEPLVVILAYMEIARAHNTKTEEGRTPSHGGFWRLAEEWHPNTIKLHEV